jgi:hypothetical protein
MCRIIPNGHVPYWTGTHGETISSDLHGAEEPTRWMLRPQQGAETRQGVCIGEEEDVPQRHPGRALPRGVVSSPLERWPWKAHGVIQDAHDVIQHCERFGEAVMARVAAWRSPRRANVLLQEANDALKGANVTLERA